MFPTSAKSAYRRAGFLARKTSFYSSVLVLHAGFVLSSELPAEVALLKVDSFLPMVWGNKRCEHDDL